MDVITKLQEAARKAGEAAERLERGEGAAEAEDGEADAENEEVEAEAEAAAEVEAEADVEEADTGTATEEVIANDTRDAAPATAMEVASEGQPAPASSAGPAARSGTSAASGAAEDQHSMPSTALPGSTLIHSTTVSALDISCRAFLSLRAEHTAFCMYPRILDICQC